MYTRKLTCVPEKLVEHGKPIFGNFEGFPKKFDIRGVKAPYGGIPFPTYLTDFRIKSRLSYYFCFDDFIGEIEFFDAKLFGTVMFVLWDTKTKKKFSCRAVLAAKMKRVPKNLSGRDSCVCLKHSKKMKISWNRQKNTLCVKFGIKTNAKERVEGLLLSDLSCPNLAEVSCVLPSPAKTKCNASYKLSCPVQQVRFAVQKDLQKKTQGLCFLDINRTYCKFHATIQTLVFEGYIENEAICFTLGQNSSSPLDSNTYNENFLFTDGKITPLPPVKITHPYGILKDWVIQDTECMVDLVFCPESIQNQHLDAILVKINCNLIYGNFSGCVVDKTEKKIFLKQMAGIAKTNDFWL